jgi:hypothetical protein
MMARPFTVCGVASKRMLCVAIGST